MDKRYFENLMADKRMSLRALAGRMGLGHSQLSLTFSGVRKMQLEEAAQIAQIFSVPVHEVIAATGITARPPGGRRVDVVGAIRGDGVIDPTPAGVVERTDLPDDLPDGCVALQCRTSDTRLAWMDGWVMFYRPTSHVSSDSIGRLSCIKLSDGGTVVATSRRGYRTGTHNLSGPYERESVVMESAAPILGIRC